MCTLAGHILAVLFTLLVCLEMSVHWQLCVNGQVPAGMGRHRGRAPKDHRGPQLRGLNANSMTHGECKDGKQ